MEEIKASETDSTQSRSKPVQCSESNQGSYFRQFAKTFRTSCILSCCQSCSVCNFKRASTKERCKTRCAKERNKTCQRCFFCKSLSFCQTCSKCPQCCQRVGCRGETPDLLAKVARARCKPQGSLHFEGGLCPTVQDEAPLTRFPLITSGYANPVRSRALSEALVALREKLVVEKVVVRTSLSFYNRLFLVPKPNKKWRPILDLSQLSVYLQTNTFKIETPETIRVSLQKGEWVTSLDFSDAHFHIPIHPRSRKYLRFFLNSKAYQFTALPFGHGHGSLGIYQGGQRGEIDGSDKGYKNPPVPRRLVAQSPVPGNLPTKYPDPLGPVPRIRLGSQHEKVRTGTPASVQFRRLPVRSPDGTGFTHGRTLGDIKGKASLCKEPGLLHSQTVYVPHRPLDSHREASMVGSPPHEANSMASQEALACAGGARQGDSGSLFPSPPSGLVVGRKACAARPAFTCPASRSTSFYRRLKRRLGRSLRGSYSKRRLVRTGKSPAYKLSRAESSVSGRQEFRASLQGPDCFNSHGQHHCSLLHQQAGRYEIRLSLCPPVETSVLVPPQRNSPEGKAHSGSPERDSGQTVPAQSGDPDRMVPVPTSVQSLVL